MIYEHVLKESDALKHASFYSTTPKETRMCADAEAISLNM